MKYIRVTDRSGLKRLLNAGQISYVKEEKSGGSAVMMADGQVLFGVKESFKELEAELAETEGRRERKDDKG